MQWKRSLVLVSWVLFALGCSDSDDDDSGTGGNASGDVCAEINEPCHEADDGSDDLATECHHAAHVGDAAQCSAMRDECLAFCAEKLEHGGGHGGHGGHGGAEHHH